MTVVLETRGLNAGYVRGVDVLSDVNVTIGQGEIVTVIGPNGAGKSTFIKAVVGLVGVREGSVTLAGEDVTHEPTHAIIRHGVGYVPQRANVFRGLTVNENLELGLTGRTTATSRRGEVFDLFPLLAQRRRQLAGTMSGGERQQLAMARVLITRPWLMLLDEPSAALAPSLVGAVFDKIAEIHRIGITILVVEQNARRALAISDRGYVLDLGRNRFEGSGRSLLDDPHIIDLYLGGATKGPTG